MTKQPNNKVSEELDEQIKKRFFAIEHTSKTSPMDIDDFCHLLSALVPKYNLKWCQAMWKDENMVRHGSICLRCKTYNIIEDHNNKKDDAHKYHCECCGATYELIDDNGE